MEQEPDAEDSPPPAEQTPPPSSVPAPSTAYQQQEQYDPTEVCSLCYRELFFTNLRDFKKVVCISI